MSNDRTTRTAAAAALGLATLLTAALPASAQIAVSVADNKVRLEDGTVVVNANPRPDTLAVIDLARGQARKIAEIAVPASVVGPPTSVAVTADERLAIVTSNQKVDPANPAQTIADNRVSLVDLKANPPRVLQTIESGAGAAGVSVNRAGTLALVANRNEGTVSSFALRGQQLVALGKVQIGNATSGPSHVAITPDGKNALVTRDGDSMITVLAIDGEKVELAKRDINAGLRPYGLAIAGSGRHAVVANIGRGGGDLDTISLIDLSKAPFKVVDTVTVGQTPEGIMLSPDGKWCAVVIHNGSNKAKANPFHGEQGRLVMYRVDRARLVRVSEAKIGKWSQGAAFSPDGRTVLVQNMVEKDIWVFRNRDGKVSDTGRRIPLDGGGAAIRTAN
jgi:DNA-binding beta-propeller fold protein YncE